MGYFLTAAGFVIKIEFNLDNFSLYKDFLNQEIKAVWGKNKLLKTSSKKFDFQIIFTNPSDTLDVIKSKDLIKTYHLIEKVHMGLGQIEIPKPVGIYQLNLILRELVIELVKKDGFVIHSSGSINKNGDLSLFSTASGGGKSTTRDLYIKGSGDSFFCDDSVIVRNLNSKWRFFSPPFIEKNIIPINKSADKAFLYLVRKSKKPKVLLIKNNLETIKILLKNIWLTERSVTPKLLRTLNKFVAENNIYILDNSLNYKELTNAVKDSQPIRKK